MPIQQRWLGSATVEQPSPLENLEFLRDRAWAENFAEKQWPQKGGDKPLYRAMTIHPMKIATFNINNVNKRLPNLLGGFGLHAPMLSACRN